MDLKLKIIILILGVVLVGSGTAVYLITSEKASVSNKKEESKEKVVETCPTGYEKEDTKCVKKEDFTYTCPKEETLENNKCVKTIVKAATEVGKCPKGTVDIKSKEYCGKDSKSAAHSNKDCPEGTLKEVIQPGGYLYCYMKKRDYNPPYDTCGGEDKSYYFDTSTSICYYEGSMAGIIWNCNHLPETKLYETKCYTTVKKEYTYTCPKGYTQDNNKCYSYEKKDAEKTCPKDFTLKGNECISEVPLNIE